MLKNKLGFTLAIVSLAIPMMVSAQSVSTTPVVPSTSTSGLIISMNTPTTAVGGTNANLANIRLDATGFSPITVTSIPLRVTYNGGVTADDITNCRVTNTSNGATLTTGGNAFTALLQGSNTVTLDAPLTVTPGTPATLAFNCDVTGGAGTGVQLSVNPTGFAANAVMSNGTNITPMSGTTASGTMSPTSGSVVFTGAGSTATVPPVVVVPTTPGLPNTGMGDTAEVVYALMASLVVLATGGYFMRKTIALK